MTKDAVRLYPEEKMRILLASFIPDQATEIKPHWPRALDHPLFGRIEIGYHLEPLRFGQIPDRPFSELDAAWRSGKRELLEIYERFAKVASEYDCVYNTGGWLLHPEFLRSLDCMTVLVFGDDPEDTDEASRFLVDGYDLVYTSNLACLDLYRSWGRTDVRWIPLVPPSDAYDDTLTEADVLTGDRRQGVTFVGTLWPERRDRLLALASRFPSGAFFGSHWPNGRLPDGQLLPLYRNTQIGINLHRSIGPCNIRLFQLPANGVMQICDNAPFASRLFEAGKEIVVCDSSADLPDIIDYYLRNKDEQRQIALNGWLRWKRDYSIAGYVPRFMGELFVAHRQWKHSRRAAGPGSNDHSRLAGALLGNAASAPVLVAGGAPALDIAAAIEPGLRPLAAAGRIVQVADLPTAALPGPRVTLDEAVHGTGTILLAPVDPWARARLAADIAAAGVSRSRLLDPYNVPKGWGPCR
ncbi:glycosyltransferase [Azospirillum formosense]|uniref:glycosyltransferase family protein n=1 Tax=Azospirillum formosense TaxID=861533 RepID=UPI00338F43E0